MSCGDTVQYQGLFTVQHSFTTCLHVNKMIVALTGANEEKRDKKAQLQTTSKVEPTYKCFPSVGSQKHFSCNTLIAQGLKV